MRTALTVLGALLAVPFLLGFASAVVFFCAIPFLSRWLEGRVAKAALAKLGQWPPRPFPPPPPAPEPPAGLRRQRTRVRGHAVSRGMN